MQENLNNEISVTLSYNKKQQVMQSEVKETSGFLRNSKMVQALLVSMVFFLIEFILVHYHELWGDEVHAWEIVRCSHSFSELLYNTRYEGHPQMWFLILFFLQKFTVNYFSMQVVHVFIAACAVFVFCFFSTFGLWQNILFCAGYFFSYEYSIISRNYSVELVFLFLCAGIYTKYRGKYLGLLSVLFFLLFQTNVFAIIIGVPFFIYIVWNSWEANKANGKRFILPTFIILAGIIVAALTAFPPADSAFSTWTFKPDAHHIMYVLSTVFTTYFPMPLLNSHFWSTNTLDHFPHHSFIEAILSLVILSLAVMLFRNNKKILLLFCIGTIGEALFIYVKYYGYIRHHGHLFLLFVLCYWLYCSDSSVIKDKISGIVSRCFVILILIVQVVASCCANTLDVKYTFSNNIPVAQYIHKNGLDSLPLLGDGDFMASGVAGILDHDMYYMRPEKWGKFILPDQNWGPFINFSEQDLLSEVSKVLNEKKTDLVLVLTYPFKDYRAMGWTQIETFENSVIGEDYYLYRVKYIPQTPEYLNHAAEMLIAKNNFSGAMKLLNKAIQIKPGYGEAYMNLADCYNNGLTNYDKALACIDSAIKYSPKDYKVVFDKGAILYNAGHKNEGISFFKEALKLNPQNINAYLTLAECYTALKDYDNAIVYLKMGLKIDPENKDIQDKIAKCNKDKGNK